MANFEHVDQELAGFSTYLFNRWQPRILSGLLFHFYYIKVGWMKRFPYRTLGIITLENNNDIFIIFFFISSVDYNV